MLCDTVLSILTCTVHGHLLLTQVEHVVSRQVTLVLAQPILDGAALSVDNSHIAWPSDINYKFANAAPTNFNTDPPLRGGGTLNGTLKVRS